MTEAEWAACREPDKMLAFLRKGSRGSERGLRLFACACVRRIWHLLTDERSREAVEMAERFADGLGTEQERNTIWAAAEAVTGGRRVYGKMCSHQYFAAISAWLAIADSPTATSRAAAAGMAFMSDSNIAAERAVQASLLRCITGNPFRFFPTGSPPFRGPPMNASCSTPAVLSLAKRAYDERLLPSGTLAPGHLAALATALEAGGCTDNELLAHLRSREPHCRGCWCLDLLLKKS